MKYIIFAGIFAMLVMAGCVSPTPEPEPLPEPKLPEPAECRIVEEHVTVVAEECGPVAYTVEVCGTKELSAHVIELPRVNLCVADGPCVGSELSTCQTCSKAMTRCVMAIENEDKVWSGTWTVAANFTLGQSGFIKEPISKTIGPGKTATFDFHQIYAVGHPITSAVCNLAIIQKPVVEECHQETRTRTECWEVVTEETIQREVCD